MTTYSIVIGDANCKPMITFTNVPGALMAAVYWLIKKAKP